jgi:ribosome-associated protein
MEDSEEDYFNQRGPSKSSRKRESHDLQDLGEELMALSLEQLTRLDLPENLLEAVRLGQSITAHGGLQRQRKFIGKLLRQLDVEPVRAGLVALKGESADLVRLQHQCEHWRDRMLAEGDAVINQWVGAHPAAERQKLRQWVRDAQRERDAGRPPRSARLLYRYLKELLAAGQECDVAGDDAD